MHIQHFFKTLLIVTAFISLGTTSLHADAGAEIKDSEFAAKVNGVGISSKNFNQALAAAEQQFARIGNQPGDTGGNNSANVKKEVLNRLIDFELMLQDAKKRGIVVDETIITSNLDAFKKQFTEENPFSSFLEKNDITEEIMKEQLRKQHTIQKFQGELQKELTAEISVSDDAVKEFYDKNIDKFKKPEQVRASHILISVDPTADEAAAQKALEEIQVIHKQVKEGTDFSELARIKSSCPSSKQGGDLGFFGKGQMVKPFEDAAFALKPGEVSAPVETQFGYHLIKLEEKKEAGTMPLDEVKARISQYLTQVELDVALEEYIVSLRDKAQITKLIKLD